MTGRHRLGVALAAGTCGLAVMAGGASAAGVKVSGDGAAISYVLASAKSYDHVRTVTWRATNEIDVSEYPAAGSSRNGPLQYFFDFASQWESYVPAGGGVPQTTCTVGHGIKVGCTFFSPAVEQGTALLKNGKVVWVKEILTPDKRSFHPIEQIYTSARQTVYRYTDGYVNPNTGKWIKSKDACFTDEQDTSAGTNNDFGGPGTEVGTSWFGPTPRVIVPAGTAGATTYAPLQQDGLNTIVSSTGAFTTPWDFFYGDPTGSTFADTDTYNSAGLKTASSWTVQAGAGSKEPSYTFGWTYQYSDAAASAAKIAMCH